MTTPLVQQWLSRAQSYADQAVTRTAGERAELWTRSETLKACANELAAEALAGREGSRAWSVLQIGNYGAAYDSPGTKRAYTYDHQPGNIDASKLGRATDIAAVASAGDSIDRGLSLLKALQENGFGVFQVGQPQSIDTTHPRAGGGEVGDREILDWLERQHVEVRTPLRYGSRANFHVSPDEDDEPSDLRQRAQAAIHGAGGRVGGDRG